MSLQWGNEYRPTANERLARVARKNRLFTIRATRVVNRCANPRVAFLFLIVAAVLASAILSNLGWLPK